MNNDFKATHVIVATSYEDAKEYNVTVGTEVMRWGHDWLSEDGWYSPWSETTVEPIKPATEAEPEGTTPVVSLFTEAQLRELEGLYGLVASSDALPAARVVSSPVDTMRRALELIAVGDVENAKSFAHSTLVDLGYWEG